MGVMGVVVKVQDRDALLVWTIPYVTGHYPSIDMVVDELVEPKEFAEAPFPKAFTLNDSGSINYLPPSQWWNISARMERLGETENNYTADQWGNDSIELIRGLEPVLVWLDEFQNWFDWHIKQERGFKEDTEHTLCLSPLLPPKHADYFKMMFGISEIDYHQAGDMPKAGASMPWLKSNPNDPKPKTNAPEDDVKDNRASQLHSLIWRIRKYVYSNGRGSAQKVWKEIKNRHKEHDTDEIIQEVTATEIYWRSDYGNEGRFQRCSLDSLLSRLKKCPPFE